MRLGEMIYTEEELQQEIRAKESWRDLYREQLEKNKKLKEKLSEITLVSDDEKQSIEHILELEKENKNFKKENVRLVQNLAEYKNEITDLKEEIDRLKDNAMEDMRVQTKLEEENKNLNNRVKQLEERLDNKEKVNKQLRTDLLIYQNQYGVLTD